jgi:hypothetical protein
MTDLMLHTGACTLKAIDICMYALLTAFTRIVVATNVCGQI